MFRRDKKQEEAESKERPRFCPNCGAENVSRGLRCTICGQVFAGEGSVAEFWDTPASAAPVDNGQQYTQSYVEPRPAPEYDAAPTEEYVAPAPDYSRIATPPPERPKDPWSASAGRLGADPNAPDAFVVPGTKRRRRIPGLGFVGGLLRLVLNLAIVLIVLGVAAYLILRYYVADQVETNTRDAIESALADARIAPDPAAGTVVLTEEQINRSLRSNRSDYEPLEDVRVRVRPSDVRVAFTIYGVDGTVVGGLDVVDGQVEIVDPKFDSDVEVDRVVDLESIADGAEDAINDYLAENDLRATDIELADNTITITTERVR
jgi:hypothetical protein